MNHALNEDPIDRARVGELSVRLCDVMAGLPEDSDLAQLDHAVDAYAQAAGLWAFFDAAGDADQLVAAGKAVELQRTALRMNGIEPPY